MMLLKEAVEVLSAHNDWRVGSESAEAAEPKILTEALNTVIDYLSGRGIKKVEVFKSDENGQHYFRVIAGNGKTIAPSEGYTSRAMCLKTAGLFKVPIEIIK